MAQGSDLTTAYYLAAGYGLTIGAIVWLRVSTALETRRLKKELDALHER